MSLELRVKSSEEKNEVSNPPLPPSSKEGRGGIITIAVAGNPNSGKSTLINAIANARLHVGNWPGVTVEKKSALFDYKGRQIRIIDLPGTYSLSPYTQEEIIARDYLVQEKPDVIINVVDATNLDRNLYLTVQLLELDIPLVIAMNMYDEAEDKGYKINVKAMEDMLGTKIIPTIATRKKGLDDLIKAAVGASENPDTFRPRALNYGEDIESAESVLKTHIRNDFPEMAARYPLRWLAFKIMEGDEAFIKSTGADFGVITTSATEHLRKAHGDDVESIMADRRYALATGLTREVLKRPEMKKTDLTERIDRVVLNRFLGIPIFLAAMWLVFKLTFDVSQPFGDWIDGATTGPISRLAEKALLALNGPLWISSLITQGVIAGVGFVLAFVPVIFAMMFFITFLEGSGYMARAAFLMDRAMHGMGLHGKSFIPMLLGFGCNVPGIYATRTLENQRDKALTALLLPLMSCGARLPVYVVFIGAFFPLYAGTVLWSMYVLGMALAILMGVIFKRTLFRGESPMFIMELPPYRLPSMRSLLIHTWEKGKHFLIKAGTYILAVSVLVWFLLNLPWGVENKKDSYLGQTGQLIAPVLEPVGFGSWEAASALVTGLIAKEIVVGTMAEIYAVELQEQETTTVAEDIREIGASFVSAAGESIRNVFGTFSIASISAEEDSDSSGLRSVIQEAFSPLTAYAFMVFVLLYMPCLVVAVAMKNEFGTWKWFGIAFGYQMALAWLAAFTIYQGGRMLGIGM